MSLAKRITKLAVRREHERAIARPSSRPGSLEPAIEPSRRATGRINMYTYFTIPDGDQHRFYDAATWARVRLTLETAGPVGVSQRKDISPVLSGKSRLLPIGEEIEFDMTPGTRLYIVSDTVNRVSVVIQPIPWLETITAEIGRVGTTIASAVRGARAVGAAITGARGTSINPEEEMPCPPARARIPVRGRR